MSIKNKFAVAISAIVMSFMVVAPAMAEDTTVVVTGDTAMAENQPGWMFNRDVTTMTPYEFNSDEASTGEGSLYVMPIGANALDKMIAENFLKTPVSNFNSISYDFMISGNGTVSDADDFYLNVYTNFEDSNNYYKCRFDYVPTSGSTSMWTSSEFSSTDTPVNVQERNLVFGEDCPATLEAMPAGSYIRAIAINVGQSNNSDQGLAGYLDNVVINLDSEITTYDFEPMITPTTKDDCKDGGWADFNTPQSFKNQGECVSFMARMKSSEFTLDSAIMDGINIPTKNGRWQMVTVSGTWTNRPGETVDAECTQFGSFPWINAVIGGFSSDLLDVQVNEEFISWGQCDASHTYSTWVIGDGTPMNLRVFDGDTNTNVQIPGWFGDNIGSFSVMVNTH